MVEERATRSRRVSDVGSSAAASVIRRAWASESSPARNAAAVSGSSSSDAAVASAPSAAPTVTPVFEASQWPADR